MYLMGLTLNFGGPINGKIRSYAIGTVYGGYMSVLMVGRNTLL